MSHDPRQRSGAVPDVGTAPDCSVGPTGYGPAIALQNCSTENSARCPRADEAPDDTHPPEVGPRVTSSASPPVKTVPKVAREGRWPTRAPVVRWPRPVGTPAAHRGVHLPDRVVQLDLGQALGRRLGHGDADRGGQLPQAVHRREQRGPGGTRAGEPGDRAGDDGTGPDEPAPSSPALSGGRPRRGASASSGSGGRCRCARRRSPRRPPRRSCRSPGPRRRSAPRRAARAAR